MSEAWRGGYWPPNPWLTLGRLADLFADRKRLERYRVLYLDAVRGRREMRAALRETRAELAELRRLFLAWQEAEETARVSDTRDDADAAWKAFKKLAEVMS
jgi:hypothetical protein